jgi:putative transposase
MRYTRPYNTQRSIAKNVSNESMQKVIAVLLNAVMNEEAQAQAGAGFHERSKDRKARRNGYKKRRLITRYGAVELEKPQLREASFET